MFRRVLVLMIGLVICAPGPAMAKKGLVLFGQQDALIHVAPTKNVDDLGDELSLCILQDQLHVFFLPVFSTQYPQYVLAANGCDDDGYYEYSAFELTVDKFRGNVANDVPPSPEWSAQTIWKGFAGLIILAAISPLLLMLKLAMRTPVSRHEKLLGKLPADVNKMADVMIHAARLDGRVTKEQLGLIKEMLEEFTATEIDKKTVAKLIKGSERTLTDKAISHIAMGSDQETHLAFLRGAIDVMRADGKVSKDELKYVVRLGKGLGLPDDQIEKAYQDFGQVPA